MNQKTINATINQLKWYKIKYWVLLFMLLQSLTKSLNVYNQLDLFQLIKKDSNYIYNRVVKQLIMINRI